MLNVLLQEWTRNNPEQARAVNSIVEGFFIALTEAGRKLYPILEVWPESHWPGFALRQADVFQSYTAW